MRISTSHKSAQRKLILKYHSTGDEGFALPSAIGIGLVIMMVGITMIVRSQTDRGGAIAQKATADSLGVSEAGITRVLALLKKYPVLAAQSATTWPTDPSTMTASTAQQFQIQILTMREGKQENRRTSNTEAQWSQ